MSTGAVVAGRGTFEPADGWGGDHHDGVPIFILTRHAPDDLRQWPLVTYVNDVRTAMTRAKEAAGDYATIPGGERVLIARWRDEVEFVLPTVEGMEYFAATGQGGIYPDPGQTIAGILADGEGQTAILMKDLRNACSDALGSEDLERMRDTAEQHSVLYRTLRDAVDEAASLIAKVEALAAEWDGDDASEFKEQYADVIGAALERHAAIALNLRRAADSDLGIQAALHMAIAETLNRGKARIKELSTKSVFEGDGVDLVVAASLTVGTISLAYGGSGIAITGLIIGTASASGVTWNVNPKYDSLPSSIEIRLVVHNLVKGFENALQDAEQLREECDSELKSLSNPDFRMIGGSMLVPGSGYYK
jgi:uncharacterized protein YukE